VTKRGDRTRAKLIEATLAVVGEVGYARASTRAIAEAAGVAEGTIYRHFPDKTALFFAAALEPSAAVMEWVAGLPAKAGTGSVERNLAEALERLSTLRERVLPLEIAIHADAELAGARRASLAGDAAMPAGPPAALAAYLAGEQRLGRVRADLDPRQASVVLLATLLGLAMADEVTDGATDPGERIATAVRMFVAGIVPPG
jgi:AcrR family transcriptional regulator